MKVLQFCALMLIAFGGCAAGQVDIGRPSVKYVAVPPTLVDWFVRSDDTVCVSGRKVDVCLLEPVSLARIAIWTEPSYDKSVLVALERMRDTIQIIGGAGGPPMLRHVGGLGGSMRATFNFEAKPDKTRGRAAVIRLNREQGAFIFAVGIWPQEQDESLRWKFDRIMKNMSVAVAR